MKRWQRARAPVSGEPIRVVVADDEGDVRMLLRIQLQRRGFEVVGEAADGDEAVNQCVGSDVDAVVLDLLMPGMNGFAAIPLLRRERPDLVIVAYTAVAGDFVRGEMARLHIPLLLKSGDVAPLADTLRTLVAQQRAATPHL